MEEITGFKRAFLLNAAPMEGAPAGPVLGTGTQCRNGLLSEGSVRELKAGTDLYTAMRQ